MRPYTRSLHPDDYQMLAHAPALELFVMSMVHRGIPHREWHPHRIWEYASIMQQLEGLAIPKDARLIDVGSGGSFFPPYLAAEAGWRNLDLADSMKYGDITAMVEAQRQFFCVPLPLFDLLCEDMSTIADGTYDVAMCISTIEHVDEHDQALRELCRITKPGGYIFITSDYFRDVAQFEASPSRHLQVTPYMKDFVLHIPSMIPVDFVGDTDLDYAGDFIHNAYSFCNICVRKRH